MDPRVHLVTLGVRDLERAKRFYAALGWEGQAPDDDVAFFQAGPMVLALYRREKLVEENGLGPADGPSAFTLGHLVHSAAEADELMAAAEAAGATVTRPAEEMFWGGYSGTFADPEGFAWEVAYNPGWTLSDAGDVTLGS